MGLNRPPHYCSEPSFHISLLYILEFPRMISPHTMSFPPSQRGHWDILFLSRSPPFLKTYSFMLFHALPRDPLKNSSVGYRLHSIRWAVGWNDERGVASTFAKHVARTVVTQHATLGAILENNGNWKMCRTPSGWQAACVDVKCFFS